MVRWAILGAGGVARKFVLGLTAAQDARAVCVASRNRANAERFARDFGIAAAESWEAAVARDDVDAVYVATPPSAHRAHALLCFAAGKPALIEKPFAADPEDARAIAEAARASGVFCMEAMWTRFLPAIRLLEAEVAAGTIGTPLSADGAFCAADAVDPARSLFDPARGGGALLHRGVYPLSLACRLLGAPATVRAVARIGDTGVDEDVALSLRHAGGGVSTVRASLRTPGQLCFLLAGDAGAIRLSGPVYRPYGIEILRAWPRGGGDGGGGRLERLRESGFAQGLQQRLGGLAAGLRGGGWRRVAARYVGNGYAHEADETAARMAAGETESPLMPLAESVAIVEAMAAARRDWTT